MRLSLSIAVVALTACSGEHDPGPVGAPPDRPRAQWQPIARIAAPALDDLLHTIGAPVQILELGAAPLDVYSELDRVIVYAANGQVTILADGDSGTVSATRLPALPTTCRPEDLAIDGRGNACALLRCVMTAACTRAGARGWTETPELREADGLASAPGAIVAWQDSGTGAMRVVDRELQPEKGTPGVELFSTGDGGRTFGRIGITRTRAQVIAVVATSPRELVYVTVDGATMLVQRGVPGQGGGGTLASAPRVGTQLTELVAANGLVGVATIRGNELDFSWASPTSNQARLEHTIDLGAAPSAVAAWDDHTLLVAVGRDLVGLELVAGRWGRSNGRVPLPSPPVPTPEPGGAPSVSPAITGVGRVGRAIVAVLANGTVLVYR